MFAIVIGINEYKDPAIRDLSGAVADAEAVLHYLVEHVDVAWDRIIFLRNEEATRDAVIQALQNLATNPKISDQDPILIYYAGHGSEAHLAFSEQSTTIQMIIPYDFVLNGSTEDEGQGLFDVTLSNILRGNCPTEVG